MRNIQVIMALMVMAIQPVQGMLIILQAMMVVTNTQHEVHGPDTTTGETRWFRMVLLNQQTVIWAEPRMDQVEEDSLHLVLI
jgi:hypothetical protein